MVFSKLFGSSSAPAEKKEVTQAGIDARLDDLKAASSKGVLSRMRSLMSAVKDKTRDALTYDVGQGAKDLGRKALDLGNMDVGLAARRAAIAAGLAGAMAAPAYAEDKPTDSMVVSGAKTELVSETPDAAPAGIVLAMNDSAPVAGNQGQGKEAKEAAEAVQSKKEWKSESFSVAAYLAKNPDAAERIGLTKSFQDSYFEYRRQLDEYRRADPKAAAEYEKQKGEVVSAYIVEGRFSDVPYPENVVDVYDREERLDKDSLFLGQFSTGEDLQKNLPRIFAMGLSKEWAKRQYERRNPLFVNADGSYDDMTIRGVARDAKAQIGRWKDKLFSESATRAGLPQKAADAMAQLDRLYADGAKLQIQPQFNPFAVAKERVAVLSWVAVTNGFGEFSPDPVLRQGDLATLSIAYAAREDVKAMKAIPVLHVGRAVNMDSSVAKAKALLAPSKWDELLNMSKPAGDEFAFGGREHLECALSVLRDDVDNSFGVSDLKALEGLRQEIRKCLARSVDVPLVDADLAMTALENLRLTGAKGSGRWKEDRKDVESLIPGVFADAAGLTAGLTGEVAKERAGDMKAAASIAQGKREADEAEKEAKFSGERAAAMTKLKDLYDVYLKETDAAKRRTIAQEISATIKAERKVREDMPKEKLDKSLKDDLIAFTFLLRAVEKDLT